MDAGKLSFPKRFNRPDPDLEYTNHRAVLKLHRGVGRPDCYVCGREFWDQEEIYGCDEFACCSAGLNVHIVCMGTTPLILAPISCDELVDAGEPDLSTRIKHRAHMHGLVLHRHRGFGDPWRSRCSLCQNHFKEGDEIYTCETTYRFDTCRFSIDMVCSSPEAEMVNLPERISHPAHDQPNTLVLRRCQEYGDVCWVCRNEVAVGEQIYVCETSSHQNCYFSVDVACSSVKALVDFRGHEHLMCFVDRVKPDPYNGIMCGSCGEESGHLMLCCAQNGCPHRLHLSCGPLPTSIPYHFAGYDLNLTLMDTFLDGVNPEDSWCDICEQRRKPGKCVYRSEDPPFTATTDCLLPQIVAALKGDLGEVKLRSVIGHIPGAVLPPITDQGLAEGESLADEDVQEVITEKKIESDAAQGANDTFSLEQILNSVTDEDRELLKHTVDGWGSEDAIPFKFSNEAFELFKDYVYIKGTPAVSLLPRWLDITPPTVSLRRGWLDTFAEREFVKVGDNFVLPELVNLYRQVVKKNGDFTADSPQSGSSRALCLSEFLKMIHGMQGMKVFEVTYDLLCTWQCYLEYIGVRGGLNLQFALDNLEKVARVCYALQLINVRDGIIMDLTEHIQQLVRDIEDEKPKLEALGVEYLIAKKESPFGYQCVGEASVLQWMYAADLLGLEQED